MSAGDSASRFTKRTLLPYNRVHKIIAKTECVAHSELQSQEWNPTGCVTFERAMETLVVTARPCTLGKT